jgi:hypothetical protein
VCSACPQPGPSWGRGPPPFWRRRASSLRFFARLQNVEGLQTDFGLRSDFGFTEEREVRRSAPTPFSAPFACHALNSAPWHRLDPLPHSHLLQFGSRRLERNARPSETAHVRFVTLHAATVGRQASLGRSPATQTSGRAACSRRRPQPAPNPNGADSSAAPACQAAVTAQGP